MRCAAMHIAILSSTVISAQGFFEELFSGGGGGIQFQMGGPQRRHVPEWPRGVTEEISKSMSWLKGTEWRWNNDGNWGFKMERSGDVDAPIQQCQMGCKWTAQKGKVYLSMGDAGIFTLDAQEEKPADMNGFRMKGRSQQDGQRLTLTFVRVFDHEAADLEKDLYGALGLSEDADEAEIKKSVQEIINQVSP